MPRDDTPRRSADTVSGMTVFLEAFRAVPDPEPPDGPEWMLESMMARFKAARGEIVARFHEDRPLLTMMREEGARVALPPLPSGGRREDEAFEIEPPGNGPPLVDVISDRGEGGILWMTSIGAGHFEAAKVAPSDRQMHCDQRLAFGLATHAAAIERELGRMDELAAGDDPAERVCVTWDSLTADNPWFLFQVAPPPPIGSKYFADYMQIETIFFAEPSPA